MNDTTGKEGAEAHGPAMSIADRMGVAIGARADLLDDRHEAAFRALNGFREGAPGLVIDVFVRGPSSGF